MAFSLSFFCLFFYFVFRNLPQGKANTKFIIYISISLILYSALRHPSIGNDTENYINMFENIQYESFDNVTSDFFHRYLYQNSNADKDPGFVVFTKVLGSICSNTRVYLFTVAIFFFTCLGFFVRRHLKTLDQILFFYIFYINLFNGYVPNSAIRQSIALAFILFAYTCLQNKDWKKFLIFIVVGSLFHKSALISLLVYPFMFVNWVDKAYYVAAPLFILALGYVNQFAQFFMTSNDVYNSYLTNNYYSGTDKPFVILILMAGLYLIGALGAKNDNNLIGNRLFYIGSALSLLFSTLIWVNPSLIRIMTYFSPLMGILIATSFERINNSKAIYITIIVIFLLSATKSIGTYHFMWENVI